MSLERIIMAGLVILFVCSLLAIIVGIIGQLVTTGTVSVW